MLWHGKTVDGIKFERVRIIDSTNLEMLARARGGDRSPSVLIALRQTSGRGRGEKSFLSPRGGLYFSILLPTSRAFAPAELTVSAALAATGALEALGLTPSVKWVNDIYLDGKKAAGILAESGDGFAIVGIGMNIKVPHGGFDPSIASVATALGTHTRKKISRAALCIDITKRFFDIFENFPERRIEYLSRYRGLSCLDGKRVEVNDGESIYSATVLGINDDFSLSVETDGGIRALTYGDVSLKFNR